MLDSVFICLILHLAVKEHCLGHPFHDCHPQLTPIAYYWNPQHQPLRRHRPHRSEFLINPVISDILLCFRCFSGAIK